MVTQKIIKKKSYRCSVCGRGVSHNAGVVPGDLCYTCKKESEIDDFDLCIFYEMNKIPHKYSE
jgi:CRISPR/Cas system-associated protein Cas10 (large subunit of type III CRISPR-Cas system)